MAVGIFDLSVLNRVVSDLQEPNHYLTSRYFGDVQTEADSHEIHFDIDESKPRITPFVSPLRAGKVQTMEGFSTKSFRPAYVKDKRVFDATRPLKRVIGESLGGSLNPAQRMQWHVRREMQDQVNRLAMTEEVMISEAMRLGQVTVSGEGYPTTVVDFQRNPLNTITLAGNAIWSDPASDPLNDLETWSTVVQDNSGDVTTEYTMDIEAWKLFRAHAKVEKHFDQRRGTNATIQNTPFTMGQGARKVRNMGVIGDFSINIYNDNYVDHAGANQKILPPNTVITGGDAMMGTRCYGMIFDEEANFRAERMFSKSWMEPDPAVRYLLMQSAPLPVVYRINSSLAATVN